MFVDGDQKFDYCYYRDVFECSRKTSKIDVVYVPRDSESSVLGWHLVEMANQSEESGTQNCAADKKNRVSIQKQSHGQNLDVRPRQVTVVHTYRVCIGNIWYTKCFIG